MSKHFSDFKLTIDWKPNAFHYKTIRSSITAALWRKIRIEVLQDHHYTCSICGYTPQSQTELRNLHVHEVEEYEEKELLCTLKELNLICVRCHAFHHFRRTVSVLGQAQMEGLKQHFMRVNGCTEDDYKEYLAVIHHKIKDTDFTPISKTADAKVRFKVEGDIPYKKEVIEQLKKKDLYYA